MALRRGERVYGLPMSKRGRKAMKRALKEAAAGQEAEKANSEAGTTGDGPVAP